MADEEKVRYDKPTSQTDLERRQETGNRSTRILASSDQYVPPENDDGRDFLVEGNSTEGYIGVDPVYQNYASETEAPIVTDEGAESKVSDAYYEDTAIAQVTGPVKEKPRAERDEEEEEENPNQSSPPPPQPPSSNQ